MKPYRFADLVDVASLQKIAEANYRASGMPIGIIDAGDGSIVVGAGWQDICTRFHRADPAAEKRCRESDAYITEHLQNDTPCAYKCANGLWDIGIPILVDGQHLATLFLGQFFYEGEAPDREFFIQQADAFGFDRREYLAALDRVPVFSREKVETIIQYDIGLAGFLAESAGKVLQIRRAQETLRRSEERYRRLHESMTDAFAMVDMAGRIIESNRAFQVLVGYADEELRQRTYIDLTPARWHEQESRIIHEQVLVRGWSEVYEKEYVRKDGTIIPVELRTFLLPDDEGRPSAMWAIVRDLTERYRAEESVRTSERKLQALFSAMSEMVVLHELVRGAQGQITDYRITDCNPAFSAITGIPREQAVGALASQLYAQGGAPPYLKEFSAVALTGMPIRFEVFYAAMQKHFVISAVSPSPGVFATVTLDITSQKTAERALVESEDRFRAMFQSVNDAIFLHELPSGRVVDVNQRVTDMYGFSRDEVLFRNIDLLSSGTAPYTLEHARELLAKAASEGSLIFEWQARHKDGHVFWVEVSLRKALIGTHEHLLATVRDISARRHLEEQLRQSQKMEAVGVLAGGVAHDFNNILQAIMSSANLIRLKYGSNEGLLHMVDDILTLSERAADLTRGLLAFSRKQIIDPRTQDLNELIRTAANLYARVLGEDIELRLDLVPARLGVHVDTAHIQQVLLNLMTNARDAMPTGGTLSISTARDTRTVPDRLGMPVETPCAVMTVHDTGHGIDPKDLPHVFEPFYTTKDVGKGTGLGLSVVYGILQQHGGSIAVTSSPGAGTTFTIVLPVVDQRQDVSKAPAGQVEPGRGETILLVEDDALVRRATASILTAYGYTVLAAANGAEALEVHREHRAAIRLVLLDVIMPGMNGEQVYEALAAVEPGLKVIFLSGYPQKVLEQKKLAEVMYLPKPVAPADLIKAIKTILAPA